MQTGLARRSGRVAAFRGAAVDPLERRRLFSTYTVNASGGGANYTDLETAIVDVPAGSTLSVAPGTYTAHATAIDGNQSIFWINKALTVRSTGGPANTTLVAPSGQPENVLVSASNVRVEGFTLQGGQFCADVQDFQHGTALTGVTLKALALTPDHTAGHGILFSNVSNSTIDGCTVGLSYANGIFLDAGSDHDTVTNNTVTGTVTQHAIAVKNSADDVVVGNTVTGSYSDGVILVGSSGCRVTGNAISGHRVDGITLTDDPPTHTHSDDNYVALNTIVSDGLAAGRTDGVGIWLNDDSDGNTVFANTTSGSPECGIDAFVSSDNLITGNDVFGNGQGGIFIFDAQGYALSTGAAPTHTVITDNDIHGNLTNAGVILRGAADTDVEGNAITGTFNGTYGSSTDGGLDTERSTGTRFVGNTLVNLQNGIYSYGSTAALAVYRNRFVNCGENYALAGATATFDDSVTVGGNFWTDATAGGPYARFIYDTAGDRGGGYADAYPFPTESLNQPYAATVTSPAAGTTVAAGSHRAIQWTATGAARVDLYYASAATGDVQIAAGRPNNGVYNWTVPSLPAGTDYTIKVVPEDSAGTVKGATAVGGAFTAAGTGNLVLLAPGRDVSAAAGGTLGVTWVARAAGTAVDVQLQVDGGAWTTLAAAVTDDHATVTLPGVNTTQARVRIVDHATGTGDTQDGYFRISGGAAVAVPAAVQIGTDQSLTWTSPAASVTADVQFYDGTAWQPIATGTPDVGHVTWFVPERFTNGASVRVLFHDAAGTQIGTATSAAFNVEYTLAGGAEVNTYRLYNNATKEHLYTTDPNEYAVLATRGWTQEGVAYKVYNGPAAVGGVAAIPEYRLYDPAIRQHLWTTDRNEYLTLRATPAWSPEGVAAYFFPAAVTAATPLYRLSYDGPTLLHLWTTDRNEYDTLVGQGWVQEGSIGDVLTA